MHDGIMPSQSSDAFSLVSNPTAPGADPAAATAMPTGDLAALRAQVAQLQASLATLALSATGDASDAEGLPDPSPPARFLDLRPYFPQLAAQFPVHPPPSSPAEPALFHLYNEEIFDTLRARAKRPALEEYQSLYCGTFFLSALAAAFRDDFVYPDDTDSPEARYVARFAASLDATVDIFTARLAFIRAREGDLGRD